MCYWLQTELKKYVCWTKVCLTLCNEVAFRNFGRRRCLPKFRKVSSEILEGLGLGTPSPSEMSEGNFVRKC